MPIRITSTLSFLKSYARTQPTPVEYPGFASYKQFSRTVPRAEGCFPSHQKDGRGHNVLGTRGSPRNERTHLINCQDLVHMATRLHIQFYSHTPWPTIIVNLSEWKRDARMTPTYVMEAMNFSNSSLLQYVHFYL